MDNDTCDEKPRIRRIAVIGAGTMGRGIAQIAAQAGFIVSLTDENADVLRNAIGAIEQSLSRVAGKKYPDKAQDAENFISSTLKSIVTHPTLAETVKNVDLAIEAIVENLEAKRALFAEIDRVMPLVEVVQCSKTSVATLGAVEECLGALEKTPIICKDTPGFVVNRLLIPMLMDAIKMLEQGVATAESIDLAMKLGAAHPMGPLRLADYVGLDVIKNIVDGWHRRCPDEERFEPSPLLDAMVDEGKLGRKSGQGFYCYDESIMTIQKER